MKHVKLDNRREVTITDEAYALILPIIDGNLICSRCGTFYEQDNPQVAQNLCLTCFQKKYQHKGLTYVGVYSINREGDVTHQFIDSRGYISLTSTSSDNDPYEDTYRTLMYWGFPVPSSVDRDEVRIELDTWNWHFYGDVKTNSVLYLEYHRRYSEEKPIAFLSTKNGQAEVFNRRKGKYRKLYQDARAKLEASKDARGYYHVHGHEVAGVYEAYIYEGIAELASSENNQNQVTAKGDQPC